MSQYTIFPIGDSAATIDLGNYISETLNQKVVAMQTWLQQHPFEGLKDIIPAYSSLSVIYDTAAIRDKYNPQKTVFGFIQQKLLEAYLHATIIVREQQLIHIPVCYDISFGYDLDFIQRQKGLSIEEIIRLHTSRVYRVYMIGFLPGFPYMAPVCEELAVPRKEKPRQTVAAGSVGLAGNQTGIYPLASPGGWQIIGRTPVKLFDKMQTGSLPLKAGDYVQFYSVTPEEFNS